MHGMASDNIDIRREMTFEGCYFWCLAGGLAANDGALLGRWAVRCNNLVNIFGLDGVDDEVTGIVRPSSRCGRS